MGRTKKIGRAGRFGSRYGKKIRVWVVESEKESKKRHTCSACMKPTVSRMTSGIWRCRRCGLKLAGKAYTPA